MVFALWFNVGFMCVCVCVCVYGRYLKCLIVVLLTVYSAISENLTGHDGYVFVKRSAYMTACVVCSPGS